MWESLNFYQRDIYRILLGHCQNKNIAKFVAPYLVCFSCSLKNLLRKIDPDPYSTDPKQRIYWDLVGEETASVFNEPSDVAMMMHCPSNRIRCVWCAQIIVRAVESAVYYGELNPVLQRDIYPKVSSMCHILSDCERINNTPVPFVYLLHLRGLVFVYLLILPYILFNTVASVGVAVLGYSIVAYAFLGLEEMANEVQRPFGHDRSDLYLESFCDTTLKTLQHMTIQQEVHWDDVIQKIEELHPEGAKKIERDDDDDDDDD